MLKSQKRKERETAAAKARKKQLEAAMRDIRKVLDEALAVKDPGARFLQLAAFQEGLVAQKVVNPDDLAAIDKRKGKTLWNLLTPAATLAGWGAAALLFPASTTALVVSLALGFGTGGLSAELIEKKHLKRKKAVAETQLPQDFVDGLTATAEAEISEILSRDKITALARSDHYEQIMKDFPDVRESFQIAAMREKALPQDREPQKVFTDRRVENDGPTLKF